jgi:hypothetical protein
MKQNVQNKNSGKFEMINQNEQMANTKQLARRRIKTDK